MDMPSWRPWDVDVGIAIDIFIDMVTFIVLYRYSFRYSDFFFGTFGLGDDGFFLLGPGRLRMFTLGNTAIGLTLAFCEETSGLPLLRFWN